MGAEDELERYNASNKHGVKIKHYSRAVRGDSDYDDTAALINELDLVISVPTAVVHLAGALGKKTIVMMPEKARWFYHQYQEGTTKSVWYPDVTMNKQRGKDWRLDKIVHDIKELQKCSK
jgi:ADP-heptose:LPS heptosyltransferase